MITGAAVLALCCLSAYGQSSPPQMIQVPFMSLVAGGAASNCSGALNGNVNGDGCPATQIAIPSGDTYSTATDQWGNIYFGEVVNTAGVGVVRVIYAGSVTAGGVANPATAMIEAASPSYSWTTPPVAGDVYTIAGGLAAAPSTCANGNTPSGNGSGCNGTQSYIKKAYGVAVDAAGSVFILDESNSAAYVVLANTTGLAAQLVLLENTSLTTSNLYAGAIYLIAGSGGGYADDALATTGKIHNSYGIAVDAEDNLYIADYTNDAVRMINGPTYSTSSPTTLGGAYAAGFIHTIAGNCTSSACTALSGTPASNSAAIGAAFVDPAGIAVDAYGNVYVGDNCDSAGAPATVRVIYAGGTGNPVANLIDLETSVSSPTAGYVYTIAGHATGGSTSVGNGSLATASTVGLDRPYGLGLDSRGNLYIADYNGANDMSVAEVNASNGYLYFISGGSVSTLGSGDYCSGGSTGPQMTDSYGDGCPGTQGSAHHAEGNISFDASGDLYFADNSDGLIRKLSFSSFPATTVGAAAATRSLAFSLVTGSSSEAASSITASVVTQGTANTEFVDPGTGDTCTGSTTLVGFPNNAGTQGNSTCVVPVTFTPARAGLRPGALEISASINSGAAQVLNTTYLSGVGNAPEIAIDPGSSTQLVAASTQPLGVATDSAGNAYVSENASGAVYRVAAGGGTPVEIISGFTNPHQIAVDGTGNVYVADGGINNRIAEYAAAATTTSVISTPATTYTGALGKGFSGPTGVAVDGAGNLYIADSGNARVVEIPNGNGVPETLGSGFKIPYAVAVDAGGNVYVFDIGWMEIIKITPSTGAQSKVSLLSFASPSGVAVDAAGDVYYTDSSLKEVVEVPASGSGGVAVVTGLDEPGGVALDPSGNLYVADAQLGAYSYNRSISSNQSTPLTTNGATLSGTLTSIGNQSYIEAGTSGDYFTQTDSTDFDVTAATTNGCNFPTLTSGTECGGTAEFTPSGNGNFSDDVVFTGNAANFASVAWDIYGSYSRVSVGTTTAFTTSSPVSSTYGQPVTATVSVTAASGSNTPTGTVTFTVDGVQQTPAAPVSGSGLTGTASIILTTLTVTGSPHTISAAYNPGAGFTGSSTASSLTVNVAPATVNVTVNSSSQTYGSTFTFTATLSGVLAQDTALVSAVYSTSATATSPVGQYSVTATGLTGAAAGNYKLGTVTAGTLTITKLAITATATSITSTYGQAIPAITGSLTGVLAQDVGNVTPVFTTTATSTSPAGSYPINGVSLSGSAAGNYSATLTGSPIVTIQQAAVAVTVNSASREYGAANPTFSGTLTGVLTQDAANVAAVYSTSATPTSAIGTYSITATGLTGSAAGNYTLGAVTAGTLTVTQATTTTGVSTTNANVDLSGNVTFTATVTSTTTGTPTGTVNFYAGTTLIGSPSLSGGQASVSNPSITQIAGSYSITAEYAGSTDYSTSTSSALTETVVLPGIGTTPSPSSVTITSGSTGTVTLSLTAQGGYTGSATFSCANLPADMSCSFSPSSATFTSTSLTATTILTISTSGNSSSALVTKPLLPTRNGGLPALPALCVLLPGFLAGFFGLRSRRLRAWQRRTMALLLLTAGLACGAAISGCGGGSNKTPAGTYTINVEVTAGSVQMVPLTVTVTQ
jgi:streptogramin lyase